MYGQSWQINKHVGYNITLLTYDAEHHAMAHAAVLLLKCPPLSINISHPLSPQWQTRCMPQLQWKMGEKDGWTDTQTQDTISLHKPCRIHASSVKKNLNKTMCLSMLVTYWVCLLQHLSIIAMPATLPHICCCCWGTLTIKDHSKQHA